MVVKVGPQGGLQQKGQYFLVKFQGTEFLIIRWGPFSVLTFYKRQAHYWSDQLSHLTFRFFSLWTQMNCIK